MGILDAVKNAVSGKPDIVRPSNIDSSLSRGEGAHSVLSACLHTLIFRETCSAFELLAPQACVMYLGVSRCVPLSLQAVHCITRNCIVTLCIDIVRAVSAQATAASTRRCPMRRNASRSTSPRCRPVCLVSAWCIAIQVIM